MGQSIKELRVHLEFHVSNRFVKILPFICTIVYEAMNLCIICVFQASATCVHTHVNKHDSRKKSKKKCIGETHIFTLFAHHLDVDTDSMS
jgi:hypothetical protein